MRASRNLTPLAAGAFGALLAALLGACASDGRSAGCDHGRVPQALACGSFVSTSGTQDGGDVDWLGTDPLTITFTDVTDVTDDVASGVRMTVRTPCNTVGVPVTVDGDRLVLQRDAMVGTLMGCLGPAGDREAWTVERLLPGDLTYAVDGDVLTLTHADVRVVLERRADPSPQAGGRQDGGVERLAEPDGE